MDQNREPDESNDSVCWKMVGPGWPDRFGEALAAWSAGRRSLPIKTLSLFTGAGGLDIGFCQAGFHASQMVEVDARFVSTLVSNSGKGGLLAGARPICEDVRAYRPAEDFHVDFIIGGPPCQTFSAAGRRAGGVSGTADNRGRLFGAYVKIVQRLSPRAFLFENVAGITSANSGRDWQRIHRAFEDAGYDVYHRILDSADYGVPQHRERLFIVGVERSSQYSYRFPAPTHGPDSPTGAPYCSAAQAIEGVSVTTDERRAKVNGRYGNLLSEVPAGLNYSFFTEKLGHPNPIFAWRSKFSDFLYKADPDRPVRTIKAQGGQYTGPFHWDNRPFGLSELKRLQTFPEAYRIVGGRSAAIQQIGNSVPPQLARILAISILQQVFGIRPPLQLSLLEPTATLGFRARKRTVSQYYVKKASGAIAKIKGGSTARIARRASYRATLTGDFEWVRVPGGKLRSTFLPTTKKWSFHVSRNRDEDLTPAFAITLRPSKGTWALPVEKVVLEASRLAPDMFTGVWKSFEFELRRNRIKADLVQLSGYYQYAPAISCVMKTPTRSTRWKAVAEIVGGAGTRQILAARDAGVRWGLGAHEIWDFAEFLRNLGFEVRNSNTNGQIPRGHILIPFEFPTLAPRSVQRHKSLSA